MSFDSLRELLHNADSTAPPLVVQDDLASAVRMRCARQRRVARRAVVTCGIVLVCASALWMRKPGQLTKQIARVDPVDCFIETDLHEQTAARMLQIVAEHRQGDERDLEAGIEDVQLQRDRAALVIVYQANRYASENRTDVAIAAYKRAIELFPQTHWAEVARQRLRELRT
jgi:hypothetical protein